MDLSDDVKQRLEIITMMLSFLCAKAGMQPGDLQAIRRETLKTAQSYAREGA